MRVKIFDFQVGHSRENARSQSDRTRIPASAVDLSHPLDDDAENVNEIFKQHPYVRRLRSASVTSGCGSGIDEL